MAARDVRKNFNLFVDGIGYAGLVEEVNPPKLTLKTEDFRGGGMNGTIKLSMGMEAMESDFSLISYDRNLLSLFGVVEGQDSSFILREVLESFDGTTTAIAHTMRGKVTAIDPGTSKAGDKPTLKLTLTPSYYKIQHGATVVQEIDVVNMVHLVNGVDQMAAQRAALGM